MKTAEYGDALRSGSDEFKSGLLQPVCFFLESVKKQSHLFRSVFMLLMVFIYLIGLFLVEPHISNWLLERMQIGIFETDVWIEPLTVFGSMAG